MDVALDLHLALRDGDVDAAVIRCEDKCFAGEALHRVAARHDATDKHRVGCGVVAFGERLGLLRATHSAVHVVVEVEHHAHIARLNPRANDEPAAAGASDGDAQDGRLALILAVLQVLGQGLDVNRHLGGVERRDRHDCRHADGFSQPPVMDLLVVIGLYIRHRLTS